MEHYLQVVLFGNYLIGDMKVHMLHSYFPTFVLILPHKGHMLFLQNYLGLVSLGILLSNVQHLEKLSGKDLHILGYGNICVSLHSQSVVHLIAVSILGILHCQYYNCKKSGQFVGFSLKYMHLDNCMIFKGEPVPNSGF